MRRDEKMRCVPRVLALIVAAAVVLAGCSGSSGSASPGATTSAFGSGPDAVAGDYTRAADDFVAAVEHAVDGLDGYAAQLTTKQVTSAQLSAQKAYCTAAQMAQTKAKTPPVLDPAPESSASAAYRAASARDKSLRAHVKAVQSGLGDVVRFCTWIDTYDSGAPAANKINKTLFSQPLRYAGTITVKGVQHTCPPKDSCYTPDQSQWPRIATLVRQQGVDIAQGAAAIQKSHQPCVVKGWDAACNLAVSYRLDYQQWDDEYASAFDDNKDQPLAAANAAISAVGAKFEAQVLFPLTALAGIYQKLAPGEKYDARVSGIGENLWIDHLTTTLKDLKAALAKL